MAVSDETLKHARAIAAEIASTYDAKYMPIYEILDEEVKRRAASAEKVRLALSGTDLIKLRAKRQKRRRSLSVRDEQS